MGDISEINQRIHDADGIESKIDVVKTWAIAALREDPLQLPIFIESGLPFLASEAENTTETNYRAAIFEFMDDIDSLCEAKLTKSSHTTFHQTCIELGLLETAIKSLKSTDRTIRLRASAHGFLIDALNIVDPPKYFPSLIPRFQSIASDTSLREEVQLDFMLLLAVCLRFWPSLVCRGIWLDRLIDSAAFVDSDDTKKIYLMLGGLRTIGNFFAARKYLKQAAEENKIDEAAGWIPAAEEKWTEATIENEMKSGRFVRLLHGHLTNPKNVEVMARALDILGTMIDGDYEPHMKMLLTPEVLRNFAISGTGSENIELQIRATVYATWAIREAATSDGECHLLEDDEIARAVWRLADHGIDRVIDGDWSEVTQQSWILLGRSFRLAGIAAMYSSSVRSQFAINGVCASMCKAVILIDKFSDSDQCDLEGSSPLKDAKNFVYGAVYGLSKHTDARAGMVTIGMVDRLATWIEDDRSVQQPESLTFMLGAQREMIKCHSGMVIARQKMGMLQKIVLWTVMGQASMLPPVTLAECARLLQAMKPDEDSNNDDVSVNDDEKQENSKHKKRSDGVKDEGNRCTIPEVESDHSATVSNSTSRGWLRRRLGIK